MNRFMAEALKEAYRGLSEGGIPIGSVIVKNGAIVGRGHNRRMQKNSAILHAEMDALENTGRKEASFYSDVVLYTTLSPCSMGSGAILLYKIPHVVIGENLNFPGEEDLLKSRNVVVEVLNDPNCIEIMKNFILSKPSLWSEDIGKATTD
jgi:creatinine deaminase